LFFNLERDLWPSLKSFLIFLNRIPEYPRSQMDDIEEDQYCLNQLQEI
jgi:hypothetical protein